MTPAERRQEIARFRRRLAGLLVRERRCPDCMLAALANRDSPSNGDKLCPKHQYEREKLGLH